MSDKDWICRKDCKSRYRPWEKRDENGVNIGGTGKEYKNYKAVEYKGTTKVNGIERDISRRVFQRLDIDYESLILGLVRQIMN